ncbi:fatty acyl-AMP ligase [Streptosporangium amethystogenes]|uniref:fatty acyl-AMP ligase n=1 Tax=Streptosporangium amethystogenes TaxID=2002 RepID=UPI000692290B|nr:fatty acyl-AMP ligase [Streptosporangium amethystogenes]
MLRPGSIIDVIRAHIRHRPDDTAYSFLTAGTSGLGINQQLRYGELDATAARIAAALLNSHEPGDRVLIACPTGPDFVTSFVGALYAGLIPVPVPLPSGNKGQQARVNGIMTSSGATAVLTDEGNLDEVRDWAAGAAWEVTCLSAERAAREGGSGWRPPAVDPDGLAFLQYTSGSTSDPRGVMVSHANLMHNLRLIERGYELPKGARVGGWLPPYHDMGLMATLLLPLLLGGSTFIITPLAFLRRPELWLEMIDKYDVVFSPAPNFAYDLCARRVSPEQVNALDLSHWRMAINGAEPVHNSTVENFISHFAPAGLRPEAICPSYGMAEATLFVTGSSPSAAAVVNQVDGKLFEQNRFTPPQRSAAPRLVVSSGPIHDGFDLRIVDPHSSRELSEGEIGEIWLRGPSVAVGYWQQEEETERAFRAHTADGTGPFLRTGDLGVCHEGELYVTGRIKEVMILNGRNIYPQDIERAAREQHPACADRIGAAFTVTVEGGAESIVLVQEIRWHDPDTSALRDLARGIMADLSASAEVAVGNIVFVKPGAVLRSTSGKVQRVATRRLFENALLAPIFEELDERVRRTFRTDRKDSKESSDSGGAATPEHSLAQANV